MLGSREKVSLTFAQHLVAGSVDFLEKERSDRRRAEHEFHFLDEEKILLP